jgi:hypothetical protein
MEITILSDQIYSAFKVSVQTAVSSAAPKIISVSASYLVNEEKTLKDLGTTFLSGEIDVDFLKRRLEDVKTDLINALLSIEQIIASEIESLVNSLINIFEGLLSAALAAIKSI